MPSSEAQKQATQRYREKNREKIAAKARERNATEEAKKLTAARVKRYREKKGEKVKVEKVEGVALIDPPPRLIKQENKQQQQEKFKALVGDICLAVLSDRLLKIIRMYYGIDCEPHSDAEIAVKLGENKQRINRERHRALAILAAHQRRTANR